MNSDVLAALANQVSELALLAAKQGERIGQLERHVDSLNAQLGEDDAVAAFDLAGRPIRSTGG